ncbi:MAG: response regulator [Vicinamibacterales bacterium]
MPDARPFVLNVNDDEANRYMVTRILEAAGFRVVEASDGREALMLMRRRPMLVVLDVRLPDISGLEVCRRIKADPATRTIPVLQTSATFISAERKVEGLDSGADGYLAQPIEPPELVATVRSLLRTQRAEQELQEAGAEWRRTFDAIADGVAILDREGRVLRCNQAMASLSGASCEQTVGYAASRLMPGQGGALADTAAGAVETRQRVTSELGVQDRLYRVVADPILEGAGPVDRVVLTVADITEHRQLEEDHRRRAEQLVEFDRRKDEFLGMLAHELRNPLNAIAAANSLMDRVGAQDPRNVRLRSTIRRQTRHLARLVDDLLEVSRVTRGKMRLQREPTELVAILESAVENTRPLMDGRNQQLDVSLPAERLCLSADALRLEQAFVNLLQNANKYSEPGSTIRLACRVAEPQAPGAPRRAIVTVADEGIGIPPAKLSAIFDLFVQVDQSLARSLGGLGLGLTIARSLVELHGGSISAHSDGEGRGAEFRVELPIEEVAALGPTARLDGDAAVQPPREPLVVLVVEDNADAREMLHAWLEELGHRVHTAGDGVEALALARRLHPDVALVDIGLPGLDGYQVAENLRASADGERTLLVAITGYGRPEDSARAREAGFDAHLVKPVQPEVLARLIHAPPGEYGRPVQAH